MPTASSRAAATATLRGTAQLAAQHLDAPRDHLRRHRRCALYVNGVQAGHARRQRLDHHLDRRRSRSAATAIWGEWFKADIDEVRIYNRALTATEIQADMNTSISAPDTTPPSAPGTLTATGGLGQISLSWGAATDNVGRRALQRPPRHDAPGSRPTSANRIAQPTGTSYTDTGLAAGTYYYKVTAEDAAGNVGPAGNEASAVATADTTPPTVSITAPAPGATVSRHASRHRERVRQRHGRRRPVQARRREPRRRGHDRARTRSPGTRSRRRTGRTR